MKKIGIFYGSTTGTTRAIAERIGKMLNVAEADIHDVAETMPSTLGDYETIVLGSSTWGAGDLQEDWEDFINGAEALDLQRSNVAIFGCGDETMTDTFCNAVGEIYRRMKSTGARFIGEFNADGYEYIHTGAEVDGTIVGLVLDEVNHPEMTDLRLRQWTAQIADGK